ncbi:MAG: hypothetical protein SFU25_11750 [Candidatus Caenarcaniphilales bacterium]|nr:hypothetical protein [Candidatus Caenarcaniphilales bacterium]
MKVFLVLLLSFNNYIEAGSIALEEQATKNVLRDKDYSYKFKLFANESKQSYMLSSTELINRRVDQLRYNIRVKGAIEFGSLPAAQSARLRLTREQIEAVNQEGKVIKIILRAYVGEQPLGTSFSKPILNNSTEAIFVIEGFIEPSSLQTGLEPGAYNFSIDPSLIAVDFQF